MARLSLTLLGPFNARLDASSLIRFRSRKVQALLVLLAVEPDRRYTRAWLMGQLWPERSERVARRNLRQALYHLRRAIPTLSSRDGSDVSVPLLTFEGQWVALNSDAAVDVDVTRFERLVARSRAHRHSELVACDACCARFSEAATLYGGDLLADLYLDDSASFEEWISTRRAHWRAVALEVLGTLTEMQVWRGAPGEARRSAARQIELEPLHENGYRQQMELLALDGEPVAALAVYESYRQRLETDLGVTPSLEMSGLHAQIASGETTPLATLAARGVARVAEVTYLQTRRDAETDVPYLQLSGRSRRRLSLTPRYRRRVRPQEIATLGARQQADLPLQDLVYADVRDAVAGVARSVILGEPGSGKTTTLRRLELDHIDRALADPAAPVPLFVPLGEWTDPAASLEEFLARRAGPLAMQLDTLMSGERLILLLDGLNEIPIEQWQVKRARIDYFLAMHPGVVAIASCREADYQALSLEAIEIVIDPLDPLQIHAFAHLEYEDGELAERFFWALAGGERIRGVWRAWERDGATLAEFFAGGEDAVAGVEGRERTGAADDQLWLEWRESLPSSLLALASNPYMLVMFLEVFDRRGALPVNRGQLFDQFVETLLERAGLATVDATRGVRQMSAEAEGLLEALERLATTMQVHDGGEARLSLELEAVLGTVMDEETLARGRALILLASGDPVRFRHQLLQEYFVARRLRRRMSSVAADSIWPRERWWEPTGWAVATELLMGLHRDDATPVLRWMAEANPEVAARAIRATEARVPAATLSWLAERWRPRLIDPAHEPDPRGRAAVGRALWSLGLDQRRGVGLSADGLPEFWWVRIPDAGPVTLGGDDEAWNGLAARMVRLPTFYISRYPVADAQYDAFAGDASPTGYEHAAWWEGLDFKHPHRLYEGTHARMAVSWFEAVAFCRWLSARLGYEVRLPTADEWERAARGHEGRRYPWGDRFDPSRANTNTGGIGRTSTVGIYPTGATPEGVHDLAGNVWEWTASTGEPGEVSSADPAVRDVRVLRGGSWSYDAVSALAASRALESPSHRSSNVGFRVVCLAPGGDALVG